MAEEERNRDPDGVEAPHDVLAADEFGIGSRSSPYSDPHTGEREPHDVLAADEFAMPTREERYAPDPHSSEHEPHDVLAAEEFAMPGGGAPRADGRGTPGPRRLLPALLAAALALLLLRRRRS